MKAWRLVALVGVLGLGFSAWAEEETVGALVTQLSSLDQTLPVKLAIGRGRILAPVAVDVRVAHPTDAAGYMILHKDPGESPNVVILYEDPRIVPVYPGPGKPAPVVATACAPEDLMLVDASCDPPGGAGPDGRQWVRIVCGAARVPQPYDWQLARLDNHMADIFAWNADPTYAYVEGESGSYQAAAYTLLGEINYNFTLPMTGCSAGASRVDRTKPVRP